MPKIGIMSFTRIKTFGKRQYAYEITAYWDSEKGRARQKTKYLGPVDAQGRLMSPTERPVEEKWILDFGDVFVLREFLHRDGLWTFIETLCGAEAPAVLALLAYRILHPGAMRLAKIWWEGSAGRYLWTNNADLASPRISEYLSDLGEDRLLKRFFEQHIQGLSGEKQGVIIDTTALPNQCHLPFNTWGRNDGEIDKQIKFLFVVDRQSGMPLYFRHLPGNLADVSVLRATLAEIKRLGLAHSFALLDAGFCSHANLMEMFRGGIDFLTRLPASWRLWEDLVRREVDGLESYVHAVRFGKRALFVRECEVCLEDRSAFAYIILDPERKGREVRKLLIEALEERREEAEVEERLRARGVLILLSSFRLDNAEVLPCYYLRNQVETIFGFAKDDLKIVPLRVHKEQTLRGFLLLQFLTLLIFIKLKKALGSDYTVEEAMLILRNLKAKVFDKELVIAELSKQQKDIIEKLSIIVPNNLRI
jgi:transposase